MIRVKVKNDNNNTIIGFKVSGHAGFDDHGKDIVCASVSALVINCINSIEKLTHAEYEGTEDEKSGTIDFTITSPITEDVTLLLSSLFLGLQAIENDYGKDYVTLDYNQGGARP